MKYWNIKGGGELFCFYQKTNKFMALYVVSFTANAMIINGNP